jgi:DNA-binding SARP family transcriptional activator
MLEVRLLGTFEVRDGEGGIHISGRHEQSLFAYLILNSGTFHRREKLASLLWTDSPEDAARENLRHTLWRIRKALPSPPAAEYLLADDLSIAFNASASFWLDVAILKKARECKTHDELISALSVYKGELLPGFYDNWVTLEREYLNYIFEHNMARLLALLQSEQRWLDVMDWGERWLAFGQKSEPAYRALMHAYVEMGEMSKVADTYARCVRSLGEIGLEPSLQTKALFEGLKAGKVHS